MFFYSNFVICFYLTIATMLVIVKPYGLINHYQFRSPVLGSISFSLFFKLPLFPLLYWLIYIPSNVLIFSLALLDLFWLDSTWFDLIWFGLVWCCALILNFKLILSWHARCHNVPLTLHNPVLYPLISSSFVLFYLMLF